MGVFAQQLRHGIGAYHRNQLQTSRSNSSNEYCLDRTTRVPWRRQEPPSSLSSARLEGPCLCGTSQHRTTIADHDNPI